MPEAPPALPGQKKKFAIRGYNLIAVLIAIGFVLFLNRDVLESSARGSGRIFGMALGCILFPLLFGWICYLVGRRSNKAGNIAFSIMLALVVFGQVGQSAKRRQDSRREPPRLAGDLQSLRQEKDQFVKGLTNISQLEDGELEKFRDERQKKFNNVMEQASKESGPEQKAFYQKMKIFSLALQAENKKWESAWNVINEDRFLDFSRVKQAGEMEWQVATVDNYLTASTNYLSYMTNALDHMKTALKPLYPKSKLAQGAVKGAKQKFDQQRPVMLPLFKRHFSYGNQMKQLLLFLDGNQDAWTADGDGISFSSDPEREKFNAMLQGIIKDEEAINKLSTLMVKTM